MRAFASIFIFLLLVIGLRGTATQAAELAFGGKLLLTHGVSAIEGAAGGGLASWALIAGNETDAGVGGDVHATVVALPRYELRSFGGAVGLFDRVELSYARQEFDTGKTGATLGLGRGFTFDQDVYGAKLRLLGDAVYDQNVWTPQLAAGLQYKSNDKGSIIKAVGGRSSQGVDLYFAATKVLLAQSLVVDATLRMTKANQTGLLGYGGDHGDAYAPQLEASAGYLVSRRLLVGGEIRTKPDNLRFAREGAAFDAFCAYALTHTLSLTAAYVDLGSIATFKGQRGAYFSVQAGF